MALAFGFLLFTRSEHHLHGKGAADPRFNLIFGDDDDAKGDEESPPACDTESASS